MGSISSQVTIAAPADRIYAYMLDPHNAPSYISSITEIISGPAGTPMVGQTWLAKANFLGSPATITLRYADGVPGHAIRFELLGDPSATLITQLTPAPDPSQTSVQMVLDVPSSPQIILQMLMGSLFASNAQRLKAIIEGQA